MWVDIYLVVIFSEYYKKKIEINHFLGFKKLSNYSYGKASIFVAPQKSGVKNL